MRRVPLPSPALYPLRVVAAAGVIYGAATLVHGSGFLAVFVAGILIGDRPVPHRREIDEFLASIGSLAEIAMFVALGLTINLTRAVRLERLVRGPCARGAARVRDPPARRRGAAPPRPARPAASGSS